MPELRGRASSYAPAAKPRNDVYVGLLILSLVAQIAGALFLFLDYSAYPDSKPPKVTPPPAIGQEIPGTNQPK